MLGVGIPTPPLPPSAPGYVADGSEAEKSSGTWLVVHIKTNFFKFFIWNLR